MDGYINVELLFSFSFLHLTRWLASVGLIGRQPISQAEPRAGPNQALDPFRQKSLTLCECHQLLVSCSAKYLHVLIGQAAQLSAAHKQHFPHQA